MTSAANKLANKSSAPNAVPAYMKSELYDSPADMDRWKLLAPLLKTWQAEVWDKDHSEYRGCWQYDQTAMRLQFWHKWAVFAAALAGTAAIVFAILQLGMEHHLCGGYLATFFNGVVNFVLMGFMKARFDKGQTTDVLMMIEVTCIVAASIIIIIGVCYSLNHRWRELRFKAEHYRMLKFSFLHDAASWLKVDEAERGVYIFKRLAQIHSANQNVIKEWIHWKKEMLPVLESPDEQPEEALANEVVEYFRERRLIPQQQYFKKRGHQLHRTEQIVRWIGPVLFWLSVGFALVHAVMHVVHEKHEKAAEETKKAAEEGSASQGLTVTSKKSEAAGKLAEPRTSLAKTPLLTPKPSPSKPEISSSAEKLGPGATKVAPATNSNKHSEHDYTNIVMGAFLLALAAAILPVIAAGIRTVRGAFEFGRNALRFESMAHHLEHLLGELEKAQSSEAKLAILRRGEYAMESEHRAWMRLMMEAEWFG